MGQSEENEINSTITDGCPAWAISLIHKIYLLELESGNIKDGQDQLWLTKNQDELLKIAGLLDDSMGARNDATKNADTLFKQVAQGLSSENFNAEDIAKFINARIPTGSKLLYCNHQEVKECLK